MRLVGRPELSTSRGSRPGGARRARRRLDEAVGGWIAERAARRGHARVREGRGRGRPGPRRPRHHDRPAVRGSRHDRRRGRRPGPGQMQNVIFRLSGDPWPRPLSGAGASCRTSSSTSSASALAGSAGRSAESPGSLSRSVRRVGGPRRSSPRGPRPRPATPRGARTPRTVPGPGHRRCSSFADNWSPIMAARGRRGSSAPAARASRPPASRLARLPRCFRELLGASLVGDDRRHLGDAGAGGIRERLRGEVGARNAEAAAADECGREDERGARRQRGKAYAGAAFPRAARRWSEGSPWPCQSRRASRLRDVGPRP